MGVVFSPVSLAIYRIMSRSVLVSMSVVLAELGTGQRHGSNDKEETYYKWPVVPAATPFKLRSAFLSVLPPGRPMLVVIKLILTGTWTRARTTVKGTTIAVLIVGNNGPVTAWSNRPVAALSNKACHRLVE